VATQQIIDQFKILYINRTEEAVPFAVFTGVQYIKLCFPVTDQ